VIKIGSVKKMKEKKGLEKKKKTQKGGRKEEEKIFCKLEERKRLKKRISKVHKPPKKESSKITKWKWVTGGEK